MKMMLNFADSVKNEHNEDDYCCDKMKSFMNPVILICFTNANLHKLSAKEENRGIAKRFFSV